MVAATRRSLLVLAATALALPIVSPSVARAKPPMPATSTSSGDSTSKSSSLDAALSASPSMSLAEAIAYARAHQPIAKLAKARIDAAKAVAEIPKGQWAPQLGVVGEILGGTANNTTASYVTDPIVDIPRIGGSASTTSGNFKPYASTLVAIGGTQELFDFGRIAAQSVALEAYVDVEEAAADAGRLDLELAVAEAFYAVQGAKAVEKAANAAYDRARAHRDYAKAGVEHELIAPSDLARAEADLAKIDVGRVRARGGLDLARTVFAAAVGVPQALLDAAGDLSAPAPLPPLAAAITKAEERDPLVKLALADLAAQEAQAKAIGAEMRPNVFVTATLSARAGGATPTGGVAVPIGNGFFPVVPNWDLGLVFSWPLFDGVIDARVDAAKAKAEVAKSALDVRKHDFVAAVRRAYFAVRLADETIPALEHALDAARINYGVADARFKGGLASSLEVADAEAVLTSAEIELAVGRYQLARARALFDRAISEGS